MKTGNGPLAMGVAAVAVLAVVSGGALAARRGPATSPSAEAQPLTASATPTPKPAKPSATPSTPKPSPTPVTTPSGPVIPTVKIDLAKLPTGREPQVAYLDGRVFKGGLGGDITIPGSQSILRAVRYDGDAMVVREVGLGGSELVRVNLDGVLPGRTPDVASLVSSVNEDAIAYGTARSNADHTRRKGNAVYWRNAFADNKLDRPNDWYSTVLAVVDTTVYFAAGTDPSEPDATLNVWHTQTGKVEVLKSFKTPAGVDFQGTDGVDQLEGAEQTFCSAVRALADGAQLWRTCEYSLDGFTPDGQTVYATPDFHNGGSNPTTTAIDSKSGTVRRQWTGVEFLATTAEDDDHLLMAVDTGENTASAIIRCSIGSGACELATKPAKHAQRDALRVMGGWS
ncbi:hypothetical protein GCM10009554_36160 [Kribbella koreensis]|uniref:Uncharacterized protein n=1 Tax=Kribbella koreensis TaxID=57909 RepID=A0ABN1QI79_9ACTN